MPPMLSHQKFSFPPYEDSSSWINRLSDSYNPSTVVLEANLEALLSNQFATETSLRDSNSVASQHQCLLQSLSRWLQASRIPHFLKVTMYLRICCLAVQNQLAAEKQPIGNLNLYHTLLQWLWECEPNWWEQCTLTETNGLQSCNLRVQDLLRPLETLTVLGVEG